MKRVMSLTSGVVIGTALVAGCKQSSPVADDTREVPVRTQKAERVTFTREVRVQGSLESQHFAMVPARTGGTIERLLVDEGDAVKQGQPLCALDGEILQRTVEAAEQQLAVARSAQAVSTAQVTQAKANYALASRDVERYTRLASEKAITQHQLDQAEVSATSAQAAYDVATAQASLSEAQVRQAETALAIANRHLSDTVVKAPIAGVVSEKLFELGEMAHGGDPVFRIDDPATLEASVFIPQQFYSDVTVGRTVARISVGAVELGEFPVTYKSPTVDPRLRTFEVKTRLPESSDGVVAGGLVAVRLVLQEKHGVGTPAAAIVKRGGSDVLFVESDGAAAMIPVITGLRTGGMVEIVEGLPEGSDVVVQGQALLNSGDAVRVVAARGE